MCSNSSPFQSFSIPAFLLSSPLSTTPSLQTNRVPYHPKPPFRVPRRARVVLAVQTSPVSGDSDGDLTDVPSSQKSYSVGVTIVSGCDDLLRRNVIEKIAADSSAGKVVVVTAGGLASTDEHETDASEASVQNSRAVNGFASATKQHPQNLEGWISCSSPHEQAEVILKLTASRDYDYVIAEGSADSSIEPQELARILHARGGASLRVDSLVTVLNGDTLLNDLSAYSPQQDIVPDTASGEASEAVSAPAMRACADTRPMMLVSLVENANVILVSRSADGSQSEGLSKVTNILSLLNGSANIVSATDDAVPVEQLVNTNAYDYDNITFGATWKKVLVASRNAAKGTNRNTLPKSLKDATFVYRAKRPFHPLRLYQHIKAVATFNGVVRSTGRIWLATRMSAPLVWNQAGVAATLSEGKPFWATVPESEWPKGEKDRERIMRNWDNQYGDRETEIVFVGMGIDKERLQGLLDGCLLQDEEMVFTNLWENFEDPFVEWVPLSDDEDDEANAGEEKSAEINVGIQSDEDDNENGDGNDEGFSDDAIEEVSSEVELLAEPESNSSGDVGLGRFSETDSPEESDIREESDPPNESDLPETSDLETVLQSQYTEGVVDDKDIPDELIDHVSALDVFAQGFSHDENDRVIPQPADNAEYDDEDVVIASWDGSVADGILQQIPKSGLPVTILTGFLGSGKTTLLNYVLTSDHGLKIAVLVNEIGEIDIDSQLVEKGDWSNDDEILQLANGCICCTINDSFVNAVATILKREEQADYLIIETTGLADPVPVINSLMVSDIADEVRVDGILTLVDAENFDPQTHMGSEAALSQIIAADTILLSKTDIASEQKVEETIEYIRSVRPAARILRSQRGRVPINMILDVGLRVSESPAHMNPVRREAAESRVETSHAHDDHSSHHGQGHNHDHEHNHGDEAHVHEHECGPGCSHESHNHDHSNHLDLDGFETTSFMSDTPLDPQLFMENFLRRLPEGVFRAKGLLQFYGYGGRYVFQLSGRRYQFHEDDWPAGVAPGNQLVIIGRELDIDMLQANLVSCLVEKSSS